MKIFSKVIALTLSTALVSTSLLPVSVANAHDKKRWHKHYGHNYVSHRHKRPRKIVRHRTNKGDKIAAGILGFAIGAIIASEASKRHQREVIHHPRPVQPVPIFKKRNYNVDYDRNYDNRYVERRPIDELSHDDPKIITYEDEVASYSYEPWSEGWANYCRNKYRSFNIKTGTFRGYDGRDHFCVVK